MRKIKMANERLSAEIKALREKRGLSLSELSEASGLSKNHLWELEQGNTGNPGIGTVCAIAKALNIMPERLCFASIQDHGMPLSIAACAALRAAP